MSGRGSIVTVGPENKAAAESDGSLGKSTQSEAVKESRTEVPAKAGHRASAAAAPLVKALDERGGKIEQRLISQKNKNATGQPNQALPARVLRIIPATEKTAATGKQEMKAVAAEAAPALKGSEVSARPDKNDSARSDKNDKEGDALRVATVAPSLTSAVVNTPKEVRAPEVASAVTADASAQLRREAVSATFKSSEAATPFTLTRPAATAVAAEQAARPSELNEGVAARNSKEPARLDIVGRNAELSAPVVTRDDDKTDKSVNAASAANATALTAETASGATLGAIDKSAQPSLLVPSLPLGAESATGAEETNAMAAATAATALVQTAAPANDNFVAAQALAGDTGSTTGSNVGATKEVGEPNHAYNKGGSSTWYRWQAPATRTYDFSTQNSTFDTTLAVYRGTSVSALSEVASNDEESATLSTSRVTFDAVAGTVYYIAVDGWNAGCVGCVAATGTVNLNWTPTTPPVNDGFAAAQALPSVTTGSVTGTNRGATIEYYEPYHAHNDGGKSVWYTWTAPTSGSFEFTTRGSDFDSLLAVYTGSAINGLTEVASNDEEDFNAGVHSSRVVFNAVAGTVYRIAVDGYGNGYFAEWGSITLKWAPGPAAPANDSFATAIAITGDEGRIVGSNWLATAQAGEPDHASNAGGKSVWYKWTAPGSGQMTLDTLGSTIDTVLGVYTGGSVGTLSEVTSNDDVSYAGGIWTSRVTFDATAGTTYYFAIDGVNGESGTVVLRTPRRNGKVAFVSNRDGDNEIFTMNADGTGLTQLTFNVASESRPRWSPDGTRIAFSSNRDGNDEIYVMNADGTGQTRLTVNTAADIFPTWSPDGRKIAFASNRVTDGGAYELFVMNADGTGLIRLTSQLGNDSRPDWSPDGGKLTFQSTATGSDTEIHIISAVTGGDQWVMTNNAVNDLSPVWSPDATKIAFQSTRDGNNEIYYLYPNGAVQNVTNNLSSDESPAFSPNGKQLLFATARDGNGEIYKMFADASFPSNITLNVSADNYPDWQPVSATPNAAPTVSITSPVDGARFASPANVTITANASDFGGAIAKVDFYVGDRMIGTSSVAPYSVAWNGVTAGNYSLTVVAQDDRGLTTTSAPVRVVVSDALSVSVVRPGANTTFSTGAKVTIDALAVSNSASVSKVDFYYAAAATPTVRTLIGTSTTAPYNVVWNTASPTALAAGEYVVTAVATDTAAATATSAGVSIKLKTPATGNASAAAACNKTVTADVVAFDQVFTYNRFGAFNPAGMMYALRRDVVAIDSSRGLAPGNVQLRADKRPRPLVLRVNEGDCLQVTFTNLLTPTRPEVENIWVNNQPQLQNYTGTPVKLRQNDTTFTRTASMHVNGLEYVNGIAADGANVGNNTSSLAAPGQTQTYTWYGRKQGQYMLHSLGAPVGGEGDGGQTVLGLFGAVVVEPQGAKWYRSQVTAQQLRAATKGLNPDSTPKIDFEALDTAGRPILNMLSASNEIVSTDLNALITNFSEDCTDAPTSGTCGQPFREFVVVFHDETKTVQAFPELDEEIMHGVRDGFAINYGSGSLGAELIANRKKLGPTKDCAECKFEEFFLESWANGDPAMVTRKDPAGTKVVEVLFPDDPSNVHHSYLGDPVRFRNIHVGPKETHVFHLHAHQWLHEPREDGSTYLDSQTISPGSGFTYEINYGGSGNRNFTVGDSIFHCHLYPHFAQGMWELWRVHDVFEQGTIDRNLPDAEIAGGTPNPAIVPLPDKPMPPMPTESFKGYPFYLAGQAGHRPPQAPLDLDADGGLPRHRIASAEAVDGRAAIEPALLNDPVANRVINANTDPNLLNFARKLTSAKLELLPLDGTATEKVAMDFHEGKGGARVTTMYNWPAAGYPAYTASGAPGLFLVNGQLRQPGAPFAEPCAPGTPMRNYRAAYIQFDMKINKAGWHDRQARVTTLEDDAIATRDGARAPEPFFFRANSNDCIQYKVTNLVPSVLNVDDFQIFTPTDIIGQHIHLVKFDVTSSDGSGNGWNYEDGTFSPGEVQERIEANNHFQNTIGGTQLLTAKTNPKFGAGPDLDGNGTGDYVGAQTTVQRWWADPLLNNNREDRTIRTVFTHDHFGPSSHQHHGLYGALVVEPTGSRWEMTDGTPMPSRADGGPTSFKANILTANTAESYREFNLAIGDYAIVYTPDLKPVNPPGRNEVGLPYLVEAPAVPKPESISTDDPGTGVINYRNEPIPLRIRDAATGAPFTDARGNMANVFRSQNETGVAIHGDPFTPLLEAYEGDKVHVRLIQGAQEEQHVFSLHGGKWLHEPSAPNSGWYNAQAIGISEHFEFIVPPLPAVGNVDGANKTAADFMYGSFATDNLWNGMWGILRSYKGLRTNLKGLPNNTAGTVSSSDPGLRADFCPAGAPVKQLSVEAWLAKDLVGPNGITYNNRFGLKDPAGIVFVESGDVATVRAGTKKLEPLVLRANAGDCVNVQLTNNLPAGTVMPDYDAWNLMPMIVPQFNLNQIKPSNEVSLHPQLLEYDVRTSDGANVGLNNRQTAAPGEMKKYRWYAGKITVNADGTRTAQPIEYGAVNLTDYGDIMKHGSHGAVGTLIVEPQNSTWTTPANTKAEAEVRNAAGALLFKEFVTVYQDDLVMVGPHNTAQAQTILGLTGVNPVRSYVGESDSEDSGMKGFNYRTEPLWARLGFLDEMTKRDRSTFQDVVQLLNDVDQSKVFSSLAYGDPETPIFSAQAGTPVRFRVVQPTGHPRQHGFTLYGHSWFHEPWMNNSTVIWSPGNPEPTSTTIGTQGGSTARRHWNIVLPSAGGAFRVTGDYLMRTQESFQVTNGLWGIFRVTP